MIHLLVKVFSEREHADSFLQGKLYARRLSWFKELEDDDERKDEYEGAAVVRRDGVTITMEAVNKVDGTIQEVTIGEGNLGGPIQFRLNHFDAVNIFCMFSFKREDFKQISCDNIEGNLKQLELTEDTLKLGGYAVAITSVYEFSKRVKKVACRNEYTLWEGPVEYYDPDVGVSFPPVDIRTVFNKRKKFAHQREYRFAIATGTIGNEPITLDIGKIDDIAFPLDTTDLTRIPWRFTDTPENSGK